jgi:glycosyltransferase involved in cell wall biosynthesis
MTAYNAERTVEQAIRSMMGQTYRNWRLLVIDDGSKDSTGEICERLAAQDRRVIVIRSKHLGLCAAVNLGADLIASPYMAILDADDIAYPNRLEKQMTFLRDHPEVKVLGARGHRITNTGVVITSLGEGPASVDEYHAKLRSRKPIFFIGSTVVAHRETFLLYGGYREDDYPAEDTALFTRIARDHLVLMFPEELVGYRISPGGITSQTIWKMVLQFKRLDYNLQHSTDLDFDSFCQKLDREPLNKFRFWVGCLHKTAIRRGAYYWWHGRRVTGAAYLLMAGLLLPHEALRRVIRWS